MDYSGGRIKTAPLFFNMSHYCLDPMGNVRHFPRGTYHEQTTTEAGRLELEFMRVVHVAKSYLNRQPTAEELFKSKALSNYESWITEGGYRIPWIDKNG